MSVPNASGNMEREAIMAWIAEGNTPEPEFTDTELSRIEIDKKVQEAKIYLASTDYKMTVDYFATLDAIKQEELTKLRADAREFIRLNDVA
jgi:hypothetical protein